MNEPDIIIKDPLYKQILLSGSHKHFIDSKEFQRLRNIKQTSFVDLVYPSANHTRFSHSIGAYHLMKKVINNKHIELTSKDANDLLIAALMHDIGHGPFSHVWEKVFEHFDHEKTTIKILERFNIPDVIKIIQKKSQYSKLLSSTIDVDKLDYMARDSYFAGVSYGVAEVDFIIQHINIIDEKIIITPSAVSSVEDLITQRVNLFKTVYFHKFAIEYDMIFINIFKRAKELYKSNKDSIFLNENLENFFLLKDTIDDLLALDDNIIMYHLHQWSKSFDPILSDLSTRFIQRKKMYVINTDHKKINIEKTKKNVAKKYQTDYYFSKIRLPITIVQTPIFVKFEDKIKKLEDISELIKFYSKQHFYVEYVILPDKSLVIK